MSIIEQHGHAVPASHGNVWESIAIEIAHCHGLGKGAGGVALGGPEGAVAIALQDAYRAITSIIVPGDGKVEIAVAVEVPHRCGIDKAKAGVVLGVLERAVSIAQQHTYRAIPQVSNEVEMAITVK